MLLLLFFLISVLPRYLNRRQFLNRYDGSIFHPKRLFVFVYLFYRSGDCHIDTARFFRVRAKIGHRHPLSRIRVFPQPDELLI